MRFELLCLAISLFAFVTTGRLTIARFLKVTLNIILIIRFFKVELMVIFILISIIYLSCNALSSNNITIFIAGNGLIIIWYDTNLNMPWYKATLHALGSSWWSLSLM